MTTDHVFDCDHGKSHRKCSSRFFASGVLGIGCFGWVMMILTATAVAQQAQSQESVDLQPKFVEGETAVYEYWSKRETQVNIEAAGQRRDVTTQIESAGQVAWQVQKVQADGSARVRMVYNWITIDVTGPDGQVKHNDSRQASGEIEPVYALIDAVTEIPLEVDIAKNGEVTQVRGFEQAGQQLPSPEMMPKERDFIETARAIVGVAGAPADADPGDTWTETFEASHQMGSMNRKTTWTFEDVEQIEGVDVAKLEGECRLELDVDESQLPANGPDVSIRMTDAQASEQVWFELPARQTVGRNATTQTTIVISMSMGGQTLTQTSVERDHEQLWRVDGPEQ